MKNCEKYVTIIMDNLKFRCRKCRHILFSMKHLLTSKGKSLESERDLLTDCPNMLWFLDIDSHPEWITTSLEMSQFSKGKLCCPKCSGRTGAFDFLSVIRCVCGKHNLPPIRVARNRVDLCNQPQLPRHSHTRSASLPVNNMNNCDFLIHESFRRNIQDRKKERLPDRLEAQSHSNGITNGIAIDHQIRHLRENYEGNESDQEHRLRSVDHIQLGDTDSDSGIQSRHASDSESDGSQPSQQPKKQQEAPSSRFEPLQDRSLEPQNVAEEAKVESIGTEPMAGILADIDGYTCPICLDVYFAPHTCHPCQHVFCSPCLRRLHASVPIHTKCPLCRQVICACIPNHELNNRVKSNFPGEYKARQSTEKKVKHRLPPLPSAQQLISFGRRGNSRSRNIILAHWAGVCFVVLLVMFAIAILATTVGMVLWYLWEISMDYFIELVVVVDNAFNSAWEKVVLTLFEGGVSPQAAKVMMGSFGHVLHTFGKFFNKSLEKAAELAAEHGAKGKAKVQEGYQYLSSAMQADIANYVLIMGIVTYLVYKFAKYRQAALEARVIAVH